MSKKHWMITVEAPNGAVLEQMIDKDVVNLAVDPVMLILTQLHEPLKKMIAGGHGRGADQRPNTVRRPIMNKEAVERVALAIHAANSDPTLYAWFHVDPAHCIKSRDLARAAIEALAPTEQTDDVVVERVAANDEAYDRVARMVEAMKRQRAMGGSDEGLIDAVETILTRAAMPTEQTNKMDEAVEALREAREYLHRTEGPYAGKIVVKISAALDKLGSGR